MKNIFVNFTNHPSSLWAEEQRRAALQYGNIIDVAFPMVEAAGDELYIEELTRKYIEKIVQYEPCAVLCQGEFNLCYRIISELKKRGIPVMAACSKRMVKEFDNKKEVTFIFERFRNY